MRFAHSSTPHSGCLSYWSALASSEIQRSERWFGWSISIAENRSQSLPQGLRRPAPPATRYSPRLHFGLIFDPYKALSVLISLQGRVRFTQSLSYGRSSCQDV